MLTWCLRVWQSSFFPRPSPSRCAPSSSSECPLSPPPLASPPPPRDGVTAPSFPPRQVPLGGLLSSPGKDLPKLSCCTGLLQYLELGPLPSPAEREGHSAESAASPPSVCSHSFSHQQPPAPSGPGSCWVQTKSFSRPLQRHCIGSKGPPSSARGSGFKYQPNDTTGMSYKRKQREENPSKSVYRDFTGSPVVKTRHFQYKGHWVQSCIRELRSHMPCSLAKKVSLKEGSVCVCVTDSVCCTSETNAALQSNHSPIKINFKKDIK